MPSKTPPAAFRSPILVADRNAFFFAKVPPELSKSHLRRGRITARVSVGESSFEAQMEPDGKLGHWFVVPADVKTQEGLVAREEVSFLLSRLDEQPDPVLPKNFKSLLSQRPAAQATWQSASTLAKIAWVHWMESARQDATKKERASNAIDMLEKGKKRVCCFDASGYFSKSLACPVDDAGETP